MFVQMHLERALGPSRILQFTRALQRVDDPYSGACDERFDMKSFRSTTRNKTGASFSFTSIQRTNLTFLTLIVTCEVRKKTWFIDRGIKDIRSQFIP